MTPSLTQPLPAISLKCSHVDAFRGKERNVYQMFPSLVNSQSETILQLHDWFKSYCVSILTRGGIYNEI